MPKLNGRELDAAVAANIYNLDVKTEGGEGTWKAKEVGWRYWSSLPHFSTSLDCAQSVESEIERRGLIPQYICCLLQEFNEGRGEPSFDSWLRYWQMRCATPEQICRAALKAVRGAGNDPADQLP